MDNITIVDSFFQGHCIDAYKFFGAHFTYEDVEGVRFNVFAPNAISIGVVGDFNNWNADNHLMKKIDERGIYSLFIANLKDYDKYKFRIVDRFNNTFDKADPYAFFSELRPNTASLLYDLRNIKIIDSKWKKKATKGFDKAINIYEVYAGGWKRIDGRPYSFDELKTTLIPYVKENGFTHIEFMPLSEYPYDGSWGYQASGYFSCTSRYGNPGELACFIEECHKNDIGVIMDMVPVHFVKDNHGLRNFDGQPLYEYPKSYDADSQWGTSNFDLWSEHVRSFLMSSASFWCDIYHIDGIRIDAVSNLIYWHGNKDRGTNEGALSFIKRMNYYLSKEYPNLMLIAEDSSDFPKVTDKTIYGGLGFDYKWDLGWMNDTLKYYKIDPIYRIWDHNKITFSMAYFYSEKFILPFSHDEVVHGKKTIIDQMWGSYEDKFAQVKNLYTYMFAHPGKKLNFMGNELAMFREFDEKRELDWDLLNYDKHSKFSRFFKDLSLIYKNNSSMYELDYTYDGFKWIDADNSRQSIYSFYRENSKEYIICLLNLTPITYDDFKLRVPLKGVYEELLNSDDLIYGGNGLINGKIKSFSDTGNIALENVSIKIGSFAAILFRIKKVKSKGGKNV